MTGYVSVTLYWRTVGDQPTKTWMSDEASARELRYRILAEGYLEVQSEDLHVWHPPHELERMTITPLNAADQQSLVATGPRGLGDRPQPKLRRRRRRP